MNKIDHQNVNRSVYYNTKLSLVQLFFQKTVKKGYHKRKTNVKLSLFCILSRQKSPEVLCFIINFFFR